jgi:hypothetical protein
MIKAGVRGLLRRGARSGPPPPKPMYTSPLPRINKPAPTGERVKMTRAQIAQAKNSRRQAASNGRSAAQQIRDVKSVKDAQALGGRGLDTMRQHRVRTGMVVGAGMSVAAAMRNTGPATSSGSQSLYRH